MVGIGGGGRRRHHDDQSHPLPRARPTHSGTSSRWRRAASSRRMAPGRCRGPGCNTTWPLSPFDAVDHAGGPWAEHAVIGVVDQAFVEADLATGRLPCPVCAGVLRPWGHARTRRVRDLGQAMLTITPRRARCADCGATHVLLPGLCLPRRADSTAVIATALAASAAGTGYRRIAVALGRPLSTVRRWVRSVPPAHAERLRVGATRWWCDWTPTPSPPWPRPAPVSVTPWPPSPPPRRLRVPGRLRTRPRGRCSPASPTGNSSKAPAPAEIRATRGPAMPCAVRHRADHRLSRPRHLADQGATMPTRTPETIRTVNDANIGTVSGGQHAPPATGLTCIEGSRANAARTPSVRSPHTSKFARQTANHRSPRLKQPPGRPAAFHLREQIPRWGMPGRARCVPDRRAHSGHSGSTTVKQVSGQTTFTESVTAGQRAIPPGQSGGRGIRTHVRGHPRKRFSRPPH